MSLMSRRLAVCVRESATCLWRVLSRLFIADALEGSSRITLEKNSWKMSWNIDVSLWCNFNNNWKTTCYCYWRLLCVAYEWLILCSHCTGDLLWRVSLSFYLPIKAYTRNLLHLRTSDMFAISGILVYRNNHCSVRVLCHASEMSDACQ